MRRRAGKSIGWWAVAAAVVAYAHTGSAVAATATWTVPEGEVAAWSDPSNWSTGALPGPTDDVVIPGDSVIEGLPPAVQVRRLDIGEVDGYTATLFAGEDGAQIEVGEATNLVRANIINVRIISAGTVRIDTLDMYGGGIDAASGIELDGYVSLDTVDVAVDGDVVALYPDLYFAARGDGTYQQRSGAINAPLDLEVPVTLGDVGSTAPVTIGAQVSIDSLSIVGGAVTLPPELYVSQDVGIAGGELEATDLIVSGAVTITGGDVNVLRGYLGESLLVTGNTSVRLAGVRLPSGATVEGVAADLTLAGASNDHAQVPSDLITRDGARVTVDGPSYFDMSSGGRFSARLWLTPGSELRADSKVYIGDRASITGGAGARLINEGGLDIDAGTGGQVELPSVISRNLMWVVGGHVRIAGAFISEEMVLIARARLDADSIEQTPHGWMIIELSGGAAASGELVSRGSATIGGIIQIILADSFSERPVESRRFPIVSWTSGGTVNWAELHTESAELQQHFDPVRIGADGASITVRGTASDVVTITPPTTATPSPTEPPVALPPVAQPPLAQPPRLLRLIGSNRSDVLRGTGSPDRVFGMGGNDKLSGGAGNDTIDGGSGNDRIDGGIGRDTLVGGSGNDTIVARDRAAGDVVRCGSGRDRVIADQRDNVARDCERVTRK